MAAPLPLFDTVTVFGGATFDRIAETAAVPVMGASNPGRSRRLPGGVGFNVATILARLGVPTRLVSRIGRDGDGDTLMAAVRAAGIDTGGISISENLPTAGYQVTLDNDGNLIIGVADMKVFDEITPEWVVPYLAADRRGFRVADANLPAETLAAIAADSGPDRPLAALTVSPAKAMKFAPLLGHPAYLFTNRREASALLGRPTDAPASAAELAVALAHGRSLAVIVTNGGEPLAVASGDTVRTFTPPQVKVRAVNGAGDSFAAGTIAALAAGVSLDAAVVSGMAAAALTLTHGSVFAAPFAPGAIRIPAEAEP